jgi:DNA-binding response OmpR family regulator
VDVNRFSAPDAVSEGPPTTPGTESAEEQPRLQTERRLILVVDDDADLLDYVGDVLTHAGYRVISVMDGARALEVMQRQHPDVVLLDMMLPRLSGDEVLDRLAAALPGHPPVVVMTAAGRARDRALAHRNRYYLPKPFDPTLLLATVETALEESGN